MKKRTYIHVISVLSVSSISFHGSFAPGTNAYVTNKRLNLDKGKYTSCLYYISSIEEEIYD